MTGESPPAVVLVRPQLGGNIGQAARAMLNFGLTDLRLVAPRDGWPNPDAGPAASGADRVLREARVYERLQDAIADRRRVYATTVRPRGLTKPVMSPRAAAAAMHARPEPAAILFGPERAGLETDEVAMADAILTVSVNPEFASLNLAQAVLVTAYEWWQERRLPGEAAAASPGDAATASSGARPLPPSMGASVGLINYEGPAARDSLEGLIGQIDEALEAGGYYRVPSRVASSKRTLRNLLTRPGWSEKEVRTLRGIVHTLVEGRRGRRPINEAG